MALIWVATSIADLAFVGGCASDTNSDAKSPLVLESISGNATQGRSPAWEPMVDMWYSQHLRKWSGSGSASSNFITFYNAAMEPLFGLSILGSTLSVRIYRGGAWSVLTSGDGASYNPRARFDMHVVIGEEGRFELWNDALKVIDFTGDTRPTALGGVAQVSFNTSGGGPGLHSAIMVADESTRMLEMYQRNPWTSGDKTEWTGTISNVTKIGINDSTVLSATAADLETMMLFNAIPTGFGPRDYVDVILAGRAQSAGSPGVDTLARINYVPGDTFYKDVVPDPGPVFGPFQSHFPVNPKTGLPWRGTDMADTQWGVRST